MYFASPAISGTTISKFGDRVAKFTSDRDYESRILAQGKKQHSMRNALQKIYGIKVPQVFKMFDNGFEMEYLPYFGYLHFITTASVSTARTMFIKVIQFVEDNLRIATKETKVTEDLVKKEMAKPNFPKEYAYIEEWFSGVEKATLPISLCHGDLTFSNMLFGDGNIALIDFNDTPVESVIFDIIKLRQDAKYHWTSFMSTQWHDISKVRVFDDWVYCMIESMLLRNNINMRKYKYWEALNYFRILRNAKTEKVKLYVHDIISEVIKQ